MSKDVYEWLPTMNVHNYKNCFCLVCKQTSGKNKIKLLAENNVKIKAKRICYGDLFTVASILQGA